MRKLEQIGTGMSLLCAVHCLLMPLLIAAMPFVGHDLEHLFHAHGLETAIIAVAATIGALSLAMGYRRHGRRAPFALLGAGLATIFLGQAMLDHDATHMSTFLGALMLAAAQLLNRRYDLSCCPKHS